MSEIGYHIYVSADGYVGNGSLQKPFASVAEAQEAVRKIIADHPGTDVTVHLLPGEYHIENISFTDADSGTPEHRITYRAEGGEVIVNAGRLISGDNFKDITDETVLSRLCDDAKAHVKVCDLASLGITLKQFGKLYTVGTYKMDKYYDDATGTFAELYWNGKRLINARYPNDRFTLITDIIDPGEDYRKVKRNPRGGTIKMDDTVTERVKTWKEPEKAWAFGYYYFDWAESTNPVAGFDLEKGYVTFAYGSSMGYRVGGPFWAGGKYYFFNVLEELDKDGEFYLDRDTMKLYVYADSFTKDDVLTVTLSQKDILTGEVSNVTFEGITFTGSRMNGISLKGNNIRIDNCRVIDVDAGGITLEGTGNVIRNSEIAHLGKNGVRLVGGDDKTFTHSGNVIENCYIHDFGEVYRTYQSAVNLVGCGNVMRHCELAYAPHSAFSCTGTENIMEYNYIHDVVQESTDAGAFYVGGCWTNPGNEVRYNRFERIGDRLHHASCIYFDDYYSFGNAYGNIIIDTWGFSFLVGGGRYNKIQNNIIIDSRFLYVDARFRDSFIPSGLRKDTVDWNGGMWKYIRESDFIYNDQWKEKYPEVSEIDLSFEDYDDPRLPINPTGNVVSDNILFATSQCRDEIDPVIPKYSTIEHNDAFHSIEGLLDPVTFKMTDRLKEFLRESGNKFTDIPDADTMGRYKE